MLRESYCGAVEIQWFGRRLGQSEVQDAQKGQTSHPRPTLARQDAPGPRQGRSELSLHKGWLG